SAQIREILISESAWEEMTCLFAPSLGYPVRQNPREMAYSVGVHPIAIGKPVQKTGLPYNNSLYPN
ncbi:hypothetical protein AB7322_25935, partial [Klebsiella pneumoniae]